MMIEKIKDFLGFDTCDQAKPQVKHDRRATDKPLSMAQVRNGYKLPRSITDILPWVEYLPESESFLLDDYRSVGAVFEIIPRPCEGRPSEFLESFRNDLKNMLTNAIPELDNGPWTLQVYAQDDDTLMGLGEELENYIREDIRNTDYTQAWLKTMKQHFQDVANPGGLFYDEEVTGGDWSGKTRVVRAVLYRRIPRAEKFTNGMTPEKSLNNVCKKVTTMLRSAGVIAKRMDGEDFHKWMLRWFNPNPPMTDGDVDEFIKINKYHDEDNRPIGHDLAENFFFSMPKSCDKNGTWFFDGMAHRVINVQRLNQIPEPGHISAERSGDDNKVFSFMDKLPVGTVFSMTIIFKPQDLLQNHLGRIKQAAIGDNQQAILAAEEATQAQYEIETGNKIYPMNMCFYIRAKDQDSLNQLTHEVESMMVGKNIQPITLDSDMLQVDSYIRNLPMAYDSDHDLLTKRTRLTYCVDNGALLPFYGRSRGTGNFGLIGFNRGGESFAVDPLNRHDRKKNQHLLVLGPTGAGKSAFLVYYIRAMMAIHRPRIFIVEAGNSFGLLADEFKNLGLSVNQMSIKPGAGVSIPPFADAIKLLDESQKTTIEQHLSDEEDDEDDDDDSRDLLGEMEIAARIMITGGEEDERISRSDRLIIRDAIIKAAKAVKQEGRKKTIVSDVVKAMRLQGIEDNKNGNEKRGERASEMADALELFCSGFSGELFNREGEYWPEVDVTVVDMAMLAMEGYEDSLAVAYIGLMNTVNSIVEKYQNDSRPAIVLTDEGHIITTNPLLAPYVVKIAKMYRKLGTSLVVATQNMQDFPNASKKMLNMFEWWLALVMPPEEIEEISRFKSLTLEEKSMLESAKKSTGKFTEGVVLGQSIKALFRNIPPSIDLCLAMTEKEEKAERHELLREHKLEKEVDAAHLVAEKLRESRLEYGRNNLKKQGISA